MVALKCEICGGSLTVKNDIEIFECEYCGTKYSKQIVKKMYTEITNTVQVEGIASVSSLLQRAQEFAEGQDFEKAKEYYNRVLDISPNNEIARKWLNTPRLSIRDQEKIAQIAEYIIKGNKLDAIKAYNYLTGKGLLKSKEKIESIKVSENTQDIINELLTDL